MGCGRRWREGAGSVTHVLMERSTDQRLYANTSNFEQAGFNRSTLSIVLVDECKGKGMLSDRSL